MKEKHTYTVKTYFDSTDVDFKLKDSASFFANQYSIYEGKNYFFEERRKIQDGTKIYVCGFCKQKLRICGGHGDKKQTLHFRHQAKTNKDCIYQEGVRLTEEEILKIKYNGAKESKKHKDYKKFIAEILFAMTDPKLSEDNVLIEKTYRDKCLSREWRKPDILAKFPDKTIALEMQLSTTFLSVIAAREAFYQKQEVFILWIFDSFSANSEEQLFAQKDILVSNVYNVFVLDEEAMKCSRLKKQICLKCYYVDFHIKNGKIVDDQMISKLVSLNDLTFRKEDYKVFYIDAIKKRTLLERQLKDIENTNSFLEPIYDIYSTWDSKILKSNLNSLDISTVYSEVKIKLNMILNDKSKTAIENGMLLTEILLQHPQIKSKSTLNNELREFLIQFKELITNTHIQDLISLIENDNPKVFTELEVLNNEKTQLLFSSRLKQLIDKVKKGSHLTLYKQVSIAKSILKTVPSYVSEEDHKILMNFIQKQKREKEQNAISDYLSKIDMLAATASSKTFSDYYLEQCVSNQLLINKALLYKYKHLFFYSKEIGHMEKGFYLSILKNPPIGFDIRHIFKEDSYNLLNFADALYEEDSKQSFFTEVLFCIFKIGYQISTPEQKDITNKLKELIGIKMTNNRQDIKNVVLRYALLLCYLRIQQKSQDHKINLINYKLLFENWTFISRVISVQMNFIIGCDLPNMAAIADNIKSYHLDYSHIFISAAESKKGKENDYSGKKGNNNLFKLKAEVKTNPNYKRKGDLDSLIKIILPNIEIYNR